MNSTQVVIVVVLILRVWGAFTVATLSYWQVLECFHSLLLNSLTPVLGLPRNGHPHTAPLSLSTSGVGGINTWYISNNNTLFCSFEREQLAHRNTSTDNNWVLLCPFQSAQETEALRLHHGSLLTGLRHDGQCNAAKQSKVKYNPVHLPPECICRCKSCSVAHTRGRNLPGSNSMPH